jgi:glyoxylate/hydroxypyruvate reductase
MKKTSILINTSRGGVINQDHLVTALSTGEIFGAGLDVMTPEPLPPSHPLTTLPNCTLIPHLGSATLQTREMMGVMTAENIIAALEGREMPAQLHT